MNNPWDIRPKQASFDEDYNSIFLQVGNALTAWEAAESRAADLFDALVATQPSNRAAHSAFISVRVSSARTEMLEAAFLRAVFSDDPAYLEVKSIINRFVGFGSRRNEIAHGRVYSLGEFGFALGPNNTLKAKWRDTREAKYQYASADVQYYAECFSQLASDTEALANALVQRNVAALITTRASSWHIERG